MASPRFLSPFVLCSLVVAYLTAFLPLSHGNLVKRNQDKDATVLILGGGVSGITAAKTLSEQGIKDFKIIEARSELGGRMQSQTFGQVTVEVGVIRAVQPRELALMITFAARS